MYAKCWGKLHKIWVERKWWQWSDDDDHDVDDNDDVDNDDDDDIDNDNDDIDNDDDDDDDDHNDDDDDDDCGTNRLKMIMWQNCPCTLAYATRQLGRWLCIHTVKCLSSLQAARPKLHITNTTNHTGQARCKQL